MFLPAGKSDAPLARCVPLARCGFTLTLAIAKISLRLKAEINGVANITAQQAEPPQDTCVLVGLNY